MRARQIIYFAEQAFEIDRPGVIVITTGFPCFLLVTSHGVCGECNHRNRLRGRIGLDLVCRFPAVHDRQAQIHENEVR